MKIEISDWAWIPTQGYSEEVVSKLRKQLTIVPRRTSVHQTEILPIRLYRERDGVIGIPRAFFFKNQTKKNEIVDKMSRGFPRDIKFKGEVKDDQGTAVRMVLADAANGSPGSVVKAAPGWGKTVAAIKMWTEFQCTGLVVVQKQFLLDQWRHRIEEFAPKARVGIVQKDKCEFGDDFDISIAMIQSLVKRKDTYPKEFWSWAGLTMTDEVHRIGAPSWGSVVPELTGYYRLGLSATPKRPDGAQDVFFYHIGEVIYASKVRKVVPKLRRVYTGFKFHRTPRFDPNEASKQIQLRFLCSNVKRNELIVTELIQAVKAGRKIIALSERRKHLEILDKMFRFYRPEGCVTDFYVGGRSMEELELAEKADVVWATYQMAKEALDIPSLDTLFLLTPVANIEQPGGRITREFENKKQPVIVDFIDDKVKNFKKLFKSRLWFYENNGMFTKEK